MERMGTFLCASPVHRAFAVKQNIKNIEANIIFCTPEKEKIILKNGGFTFSVQRKSDKTESAESDA